MNTKETLFKTIFLIIINIMVLDYSYSQDWANLSRYHIENSELPKAKTGEERVVFMGNSITEGWLDLRPEFFNDKPYINRGIGGQTTPQMLLRFRQDVIELQPSVVVILAGINDIAENTGPITIEAIAGNIISMVELAATNKIKVVLCSVLPAADFLWNPGLNPSEKVVKLNSLIRSYANENNIIYVDYYSAMVNKSNGLKSKLSEDGVHPNEKGYAVMEPLLKEALLEVQQQIK